MSTWKDVLEPILLSAVVGTCAGVAVLLIRAVRTQMAVSQKLQSEGVVTQGTIIRKWTEVRSYYSSSDRRNHSRTAKCVHYSFYSEQDGKKVLVTMPSTEMLAPDWDGFVDGCAVDVKYLPNNPAVHDLVPSLNFILSGQAHFGLYLTAGGLGLFSCVWPFFLVPGKAWYVILGMFLGFLSGIGLVQLLAGMFGFSMAGLVGRFGSFGSNDALHENNAAMTNTPAVPYDSMAQVVEVSDSEKDPLMTKISAPTNKPADGIVGQLYRCCGRKV